MKLMMGLDADNIGDEIGYKIYQLSEMCVKQVIRPHAGHAVYF